MDLFSPARYIQEILSAMSRAPTPLPRSTEIGSTEEPARPPMPTQRTGVHTAPEALARYRDCVYISAELTRQTTIDLSSRAAKTSLGQDGIQTRLAFSPVWRSVLKPEELGTLTKSSRPRCLPGPLKPSRDTGSSALTRSSWKSSGVLAHHHHRPNRRRRQQRLSLPSSQLVSRSRR